MYPHILEEHLQKYKASTQKPFAVNLPLFYPDIEQHIALILKYKVPIVFTSAGNPSTYTQMFKDHGIKVVHVVSNVKFALKAESSGVDAIVAEGFEAGGHNGREETTTLCLIPQIVKAVKIPVLAAGGIGSGRAILAMLALGAEGVQIGSRFVVAEESSAHQAFKQAVVEATDGSTQLSLKKLMPVRLLKNPFFEKVAEAEMRGASKEELAQILGRARAKRGMFEGDLTEGELEIGQISGSIDRIQPAAEILNELIEEFNQTAKQLGGLTL